MKESLLVVLLLFMLGSCQLKEAENQADKSFADQHFKSAIALIELYHLRNGYYPNTLKDITYKSEFDIIDMGDLTYERLDTGYRLDVGNGIFTQTKIQLRYPAGFWKGLGIRKTNVGRD